MGIWRECKMVVNCLGRCWSGVQRQTRRGSTLYLGNTSPKEVVAHELGHVWDINSGNSYGLFGGGVATMLAKFIGIKGGIGGICQFCNYSKDSWLRPQIPARSEFIYS